jgi:hypothetical protein
MGGRMKRLPFAYQRGSINRIYGVTYAGKALFDGCSAFFGITWTENANGSEQRANIRQDELGTLC